MIQDSLQQNGHFPFKGPTQYITLSLLLEVLRANDLFYPDSSKPMFGTSFQLPKSLRGLCVTLHTSRGDLRGLCPIDTTQIPVSIPTELKPQC